MSAGLKMPDARIRLISYDRPAMAVRRRSRRTVASAANDAATIAQALGLEQLFVWGLSAAGPMRWPAPHCGRFGRRSGVLASIAPYPADGLTGGWAWPKTISRNSRPR